MNKPRNDEELVDGLPADGRWLPHTARSFRRPTTCDVHGGENCTSCGQLWRNPEISNPEEDGHVGS